jgi:hypothetical protein
MAGRNSDNNPKKKSLGSARFGHFYALGETSLTIRRFPVPLGTLPRSIGNLKQPTKEPAVPQILPFSIKRTTVLGSAALQWTRLKEKSMPCSVR